MFLNLLLLLFIYFDFLNNNVQWRDVYVITSPINKFRLVKRDMDSRFDIANLQSTNVGTYSFSIVWLDLKSISR